MNKLERKLCIVVSKSIGQKFLWVSFLHVFSLEIPPIVVLFHS